LLSLALASPRPFARVSSADTSPRAFGEFHRHDDIGGLVGDGYDALAVSIVLALIGDRERTRLGIALRSVSVGLSIDVHVL
jgi:hypothetical protein